MDNYNIAIIMLLAVVTALCIMAVVLYLKKLPIQERETKIKAWLLYAVSIAEKNLGSGTGQLKLALVYDMFLSKFPFASRIISFTIFTQLVDKALGKMKEMIDGNKKIEAVIAKGGE